MKTKIALIFLVQLCSGCCPYDSAYQIDEPSSRSSPLYNIYVAVPPTTRHGHCGEKLAETTAKYLEREKIFARQAVISKLNKTDPRTLRHLRAKGYHAVLTTNVVNIAEYRDIPGMSKVGMVTAMLFPIACPLPLLIGAGTQAAGSITCELEFKLIDTESGSVLCTGVCKNTASGMDTEGNNKLWKEAIRNIIAEMIHKIEAADITSLPPT